MSTGEILPANFFGEPGLYSHSFYCVGLSGYSNTLVINLNVTAPTVEPTVEPGFRGAYVVEAISYNTDIRPDLYVRPASGNNNSGVAPFILVSQANSNIYSFAGFTGTRPGALLQSDVTFTLGDLDADGLDDMLIKNIAEADDVIIYAPKASKAVPGGFGERDGYVVVDENFQTYFDELYHATTNPNYFNEATYTQIQTTVTWLRYSGWGPCEEIIYPGGYGDINNGVEEDYQGPIVIPTFNASLCSQSDGWNDSYAVIDDVVTLWKIIYQENGDVNYGVFHPETNKLRCVLWCPIQPQYPLSGGIFNKGQVTTGSHDAKRFSESISGVLGRTFMDGILLDSGLIIDDSEIVSNIRRILDRMDHPSLAPDERASTQIPSDTSVPESQKLTQTISRTKQQRVNAVVNPPANQSHTGITVEEFENQTVITVKARVFSVVDQDETDFINAVEKHWEKSVFTPDANQHEYKLNIELEKVDTGSAATIIINRHNSAASIKSTCQTTLPRPCERDPQLKGAAEIEFYEPPPSEGTLTGLDAIFAHEFGHIIGLGDLYKELDANGNPVGEGQGENFEAVPGHKDDIMGTGEDVKWYHMTVLSDLHGGGL